MQMKSAARLINMRMQTYGEIKTQSASSCKKSLLVHQVLLHLVVTVTSQRQQLMPDTLDLGRTVNFNGCKVIMLSSMLKLTATTHQSNSALLRPTAPSLDFLKKPSLRFVATYQVQKRPV